MQDTLLFKKVYGCMLGGAIGDALGGPVEHWTPEEIRETYGGNLDRYVPYDRGPSYHGHFGRGERVGAYTDDTRLKHLYCRAIMGAGGVPRSGDLAHVLAQAYHHAPHDLYEGFVEEYYFKAIWGRDKVIFGGEPTNGALMANSPLGLVCACRPHLAYQVGFDLAWLTDGYAKTASAMLVAAVAEAMRPGATVEGIVQAAIDAHLAFARRREGHHWHTLEWRYDPNLNFLQKALEIAREQGDVFALRDPLMETLEWGHLFSEATHTLVVALAMFVAAEGDLYHSIVGALMYGRDKDSYASVAGALAGAFHGADAVPQRWIDPLLEANPEVDVQELSASLTAVIAADYEEARANLDDLGALL